MFIRNGPGAARLPPTVTKLHLEFAHKHDDGHAGPRKFWQRHLPSLKYHNPTIPMIVNRTRDQSITPTLTIYMTGGPAAPLPLLEAPSSSSSSEQDKGDTIQQPAPKKAVAIVSDPWQHIGSSTEGSTPAPEARSGETVVKINLRGVLSDVIWKQFVSKTGATPVEPSAADVEEMERLGALEAQAEVDRQVQKAYRDKLKQEKQMLERARQEADALKSE